ncbi:MAG: HAD-IB family phosphatase [Candidatus Methanodesulfokora sp.]|jgi:HAD superfamily PSPase-like hydrolase
MNEKKAIAVFDLDGTFIDVDSSWRLIHRILETEKAAEDNMKLYMKGEISYEEWAKRDVALWTGVSMKYLAEKVKATVKPMKNMDTAVNLLRRSGIAVGVISSGIDAVLSSLENIELDFIKINRMILENDLIRGVKVEVGFDKRDILMSISRDMAVPMRNIAVVGDGENDVSMFELPVGLRIAFNPRSRRLAELADYIVSYKDLLPVAKIILDWFSDLESK